MTAPAPYCNTTVVTPFARPTSPVGFRTIPSRTTLEDLIKILNDNFSEKKQQEEFDRRLNNDIKKPSGDKLKSKPGSQSRDAARDEISKLDFRETAIVRKKIKVFNPQDEDMWIIDDRIVSLVMKDKRTGAQWVFSDPQAAAGVAAGNEESNTSAGGSSTGSGGASRGAFKTGIGG